MRHGRYRIAIANKPAVGHCEQSRCLNQVDHKRHSVVREKTRYEHAFGQMISLQSRPAGEQAGEQTYSLLADPLGLIVKRKERQGSFSSFASGILSITFFDLPR